MTIDKHEPIYPFRAESFDIVKNPANTNDWRVSENLEDKFYGYGFVDSPNAPLPYCIEEVLDMQMNQRMCFNFDKPIC